jgi:membrane protease YdiL (CAAX protease family)
MAGALLPGTPVERCHFAAISIGAGITEELLFRGFLIWYLGFYFPRLNSLELIAISSILFGVCHLYQGVLGVIGTGVIGAVFASLYLSTGSLLLPATVHALVDMRMLAILTPGRLQRLQPKISDCSPQEAGSTTAKDD